MGGLWSELGKKLAERWLSVLVLPGVLYLAVAAAAHTLGQRHALDAARLVREVDAVAARPAVTGIGGQIVFVGAIVLAAAVAGTVAEAAGSLVERLVIAAGWRTWPAPFSALAGWWTERRRRSWDDAHSAYHEGWTGAMAPEAEDRPDPAVWRAAARRRSRIALERPERPTWSGDRIQAAAVRLDRDHKLDLAVVWPHLEVVLPEAMGNRIADARAALARATVLAGWALLYAPLVLWWWPAAPLALVLAGVARHRTRSCVDSYARLLEVAARLHVCALAAQLGFSHTEPLSEGLGARLTHHLRTGLLPPPEAPMRDGEGSTRAIPAARSDG
ncbi:hypothetical protein ACF9IK_00540 [Kitasatospora hibisci]|uniref:hypothetical protein n=1 Tax=Kitasatospora hibisci TaxID=3369522 RepID=UPI0037544C7F